MSIYEAADIERKRQQEDVALDAWEKDSTRAGLRELTQMSQDMGLYDVMPVDVDALAQEIAETDPNPWGGMDMPTKLQLQPSVRTTPNGKLELKIPCSGVFSPKRIAAEIGKLGYDPERFFVRTDTDNRWNFVPGDVQYMTLLEV